MLLVVLLVVAGALGLFAVVAATRPSAYRVERTLEIAAPVGRVFEVISDTNLFANVVVLFGSPMNPADGTLTIEEMVPDRKVLATLQMVKPMKSTAMIVVAVDATPTGTRATWRMAGHHNFAGRAMGLLANMDKMMGGDIDKALARLATAATRPSS